MSGLKRYLGGLPSAVFQKSQPGRKWGVGDRAATYVKLGLEYSLGESRLFVFSKRLFGTAVEGLLGAAARCIKLGLEHSLGGWLLLAELLFGRWVLLPVRSWVQPPTSSWGWSIHSMGGALMGCCS